MITKQEFENAQQVVFEYKSEINKQLISKRTCICCKQKEVKPLEGMGLAEGSIKSTEQEQGCWNDGTVEKVTFGYGSRHDMRSFYVAICDDCIEQLEKDGLIVDIKTLRKEEKKHGL